MADSYEISTDGLVYTFHIREDAYYSDGVSVTAYDFERAFFHAREENPDSVYGIALDAIESVYYKDSKTAREALKEGMVDLVPMATDVIEQNEKEVQRRAITGTSDDIYMDLSSDSVLNNRNLRLALNDCLDREQYVESLGNNLIEPKVRCVPPVGEGSCQRYIKRNPENRISLHGDQERARKYLKKALEELGIHDGEKLHIPFAVHDDTWSRKEAAAVSEQWERVLGVVLDVYYVNGKEMEQELGKNKGLTLSGDAAEFSEPEEYLRTWDYPYLPKEESHVEQFHQYMMQAKNQTDEEIRFNILYEAEQISNEEKNV